MVREHFSPVGSIQGLTLHPKQKHLKHLCISQEWLHGSRFNWAAYWILCIYKVHARLCRLLAVVWWRGVYVPLNHCLYASAGPHLFQWCLVQYPARVGDFSLWNVFGECITPTLKSERRLSSLHFWSWKWRFPRSPEVITGCADLWAPVLNSHYHLHLDLFPLGSAMGAVVIVTCWPAGAPDPFVHYCLTITKMLIE